MEKKEITCDSCGSALRIAEGGGRAVCPYCGRTYILEEKAEGGMRGILARVQERAGVVAANFGLNRQRTAADAFGADGREEERRLLSSAKTQNGELTEYRGTASGEAVRVPDEIASVRKKAAYKNQMVGRVSFAPGVKKIGKRAFSRCAQLMRVRMEGVTDLGTKAFANCPALSEVTIASFIPNIGRKVFAHCPRITRVILPRNMEPSVSRLFGRLAKFRIVFIFFEN